MKKKFETSMFQTSFLLLYQKRSFSVFHGLIFLPKHFYLPTKIRVIRGQKNIVGKKRFLLPAPFGARGGRSAERPYLFPFARLCILQSIWQLLMSVAPPLLHAATWSASISASFHTRAALAS